jgi:hypothetical protein
MAYQEVILGLNSFPSSLNRKSRPSITRPVKLFFSAEADRKHQPITEAESKTMKQGWPCPSYVLITVNGIEEVIAHIEKGDIVYIVEPSEVTPGNYSNAEFQKRCSTLKYYD